MHVCERLLRQGCSVIGLDNLNDYYDVSLKQARLSRLESYGGFGFHRLDLSDRAGVGALFEEVRPEYVVHLAAQAGVRYSLTHPEAYVDSNLVGFAHVLEGCSAVKVKHLVFASSSSVYGANTKLPYSENDPVDHPVSLYAATKKANELMAHSYAHLYGIPCTGLRFFTVYGPWGRPDMAYFSFTRDILAGDPIRIFNHGDMQRDFTYIDDIVDGMLCVLDRPPAPDSDGAPWVIYNIGNDRPVRLGDFVDILERALGKKAVRQMEALQPGDVLATHADISALRRLGYDPVTSIEQGLADFVAWYREYFGIGD